MLGSDYDNETINLMRVVIYRSTHSSSLCKLMLTSTFRPQCIKCCCNYTILPLEKHQQLHAECYIVGNRTSFSFTSLVIYNTELTELPWPWWLRTFINNNNFRFVLSPENDLWPSRKELQGIWTKNVFVYSDMHLWMIYSYSDYFPEDQRSSCLLKHKERQSRRQSRGG